jgi:hypothetical protein
MGILFKKKRQTKVISDTSANWVRNMESQRSMKEYAFQFGGNPII